MTAAYVTARARVLRIATLVAFAAAIGVSTPAAHAEKSTLVRNWPAGERQVAQYRGDTGQLCLVPFEDQTHKAGFVLMKNDAGLFGVVLNDGRTWPGAEQATFTIDGSSHSFQMEPADMPGGLGFHSTETGQALDFLHDLYNGQTLSISAGRYHGSYGLAGSARAITVLNQCRDTIVAEALRHAAPQQLPASPAQSVVQPPAQTGEVQLIDDGLGTFQVDASLNGSAPLRFILDTGASGVSIPQSLADRLIAEGRLSVADYRGSADSELADGSKQRVQIYLLKSVTIGGRTVTNVLCTIGGNNDPLLLGQTVLRKFKSWSIDNERHVLSLNDAVSFPPPAVAPVPAYAVPASTPIPAPAMVPAASEAAVPMAAAPASQPMSPPRQAASTTRAFAEGTSRLALASVT